MQAGSARGARRTKCATIQHVEAVRRLRKVGFVPQRSVWLFFVLDEKIGGAEAVDSVRGRRQGLRAERGPHEGREAGFDIRILPSAPLEEFEARVREGVAGMCSTPPPTA